MGGELIVSLYIEFSCLGRPGCLCVRELGGWSVRMLERTSARFRVSACTAVLVRCPGVQVSGGRSVRSPTFTDDVRVTTVKQIDPVFGSTSHCSKNSLDNIVAQLTC